LVQDQQHAGFRPGLVENPAGQAVDALHLGQLVAQRREHAPLQPDQRPQQQNPGGAVAPAGHDRCLLIALQDVRRAACIGRHAFPALSLLK
jgi:hypothetical protein